MKRSRGGQRAVRRQCGAGEGRGGEVAGGQVSWRPCLLGASCVLSGERPRLQRPLTWHLCVIFRTPQFFCFARYVVLLLISYCNYVVFKVCYRLNGGSWELVTDLTLRVGAKMCCKFQSAEVGGLGTFLSPGIYIRKLQKFWVGAWWPRACVSLRSSPKHRP